MTDTQKSAWGDKETEYFFTLTPERILEAVETTNLRCTGRCLALNSMENRVYEVEIELDQNYKPKSPSEKFRIAKFYRPGRWSKQQILDEHEFLHDLVDREIPVVAPIKFEDGSTLKKMPETDILFCIFPKIGGRLPQELSSDQIERVGRLLGRMHNVGSIKPAKHRLNINPQTYGYNNLQYLLETKALPAQIEETYKSIVEKICEISAPWFENIQIQRIHGDCHLGNLVWGSDGPFWVDFDDMLMGPCVQDLWLMIPGRDQQAKEQLELLISSYQQMYDFDRSTLRLIEVLRALRYVHFSAWISKRWSDPAFPRAFPEFGSEKYWQTQVSDLREQLGLLERA